MALSEVDKLVGVGIVPEQAKRIVEAASSSGLQIGTTGTTAMAGNRVPTATIRGGVLQQGAIADLAGGADLPTTVTKVNAILAALRSAGVIAT